MCRMDQKKNIKVYTKFKNKKKSLRKMIFSLNKKIYLKSHHLNNNSTAALITMSKKSINYIMKKSTIQTKIVKTLKLMDCLLITDTRV